ncbi:hypothetical protein RHGRI_038715 [Rhododendron griersonianum]|uniref:Uncharacterized protein n=1 Tax=Rhododendron griersonianum TaxID=479676 RepID=A0AAV6HIX2_9ERIC|nr:hypothetical protein RHGRI_038715 [Rhododendron griersonianum]
MSLLHHRYILKELCNFELAASSSACRGGITLSSVNNIPPSRFRPPPLSSLNSSMVVEPPGTPSATTTATRRRPYTGSTTSVVALVASPLPPSVDTVVVPHRAMLWSWKTNLLTIYFGCRLRWCRQLSPPVEYRAFTAKEDKAIVIWATIARLFPSDFNISPSDEPPHELIRPVPGTGELYPLMNPNETGCSGSPEMLNQWRHTPPAGQLRPLDPHGEKNPSPMFKTPSTIGQITVENEMGSQNPEPNEFQLDSFEDMNFRNTETGSTAEMPSDWEDLLALEEEPFPERNDNQRALSLALGPYQNATVDRALGLLDPQAHSLG